MPLDLAKIEDSSHLLDLLIQMEDVLDSLDIYVYRNWFNGEVVEGPKITRHWCEMSLLYPYLKMPDPRAILRLKKHGVLVDFNKVTQEADRNGDTKVQQEQQQDWLLELRFPRRLLSQMSGVDLDLYDDDVDVDDVEDANDAGIDKDSGMMRDEQMPDAGDMPDGDPTEDAPDA